MLYRNGRFIELFYYRKLYNSKSKLDIDIEKLAALSFIECGWLIPEDNLLENCIKLDVEESKILYLRLIYNLRSGNLSRAYDFANDILLRNDFLELELNAIIELSIRLKDAQMICNALNYASKRNIKITLGKARERIISMVLKRHLIKILNNVKKKKNE